MAMMIHESATASRRPRADGCYVRIMKTGESGPLSPRGYGTRASYQAAHYDGENGEYTSGGETSGEARGAGASA